MLPEQGRRATAGSATTSKAEDFQKNRADVVSRCIERGINYIDACVGCEVLAYAKALKGRRDKMYLGFSWYEGEMRRLGSEADRAAKSGKPMPPGWITKKLKECMDHGLKQSGLGLRRPVADHLPRRQRRPQRRPNGRDDGRPGVGQEGRQGPVHRLLLPRPPAHQAAHRERIPQVIDVDRARPTPPRPRWSKTRPASGRR